MSVFERNKITYIHFILSVLVILIHSINNTTKFESFFSIESGIGQFAVPLFFVVSGFLFFRNVNSAYDVQNKLKERLFTLIRPFAIWNLIYYFLHYLMKPGQNFSFDDLFSAVIMYKYNPAFWFIFQLILLCFLSYIIVRFFNDINKLMAFIFIMMFFIIFNIDIPYINEDAIIYFSAGILFEKLYRQRKIRLIDKRKILYFLIFFIVAFIINRLALRLTMISLSYIPIFTLTIVVVRLTFSFFLFYIFDIIFKYDFIPKFFSANFFLYAIHYMIVRAIINMLEILRMRLPQIFMNNIIDYILFILSPIICILINYYLTNFLKRRYRNIYNILSGGRE